MSSQTEFRTAASTSQSVLISLVQNAGATSPGNELTGVVYNSAGLTAYYKINGTGAATAITLATQTATGAYSSGGFVAADGTNMPGMYRLDLPNAVLATAGSVMVTLKGATDMATHHIKIIVTAVDLYDATRMGLSALPNAAAAASGGLPINGANSGNVSFAGTYTHTGNVTYSDGITVSAPSTSNRSGVTITGNGTGSGVLSTGGTTGHGFSGVGGATSGNGIRAAGTAGNSVALNLIGQGSAAALLATGGATGHGISVVGGGTSGNGVNVTTTSGHGVNLAPVGTNMHGLLTTGGNGGTSDGLKAVAGTGGVPIRGDITGNITGTVSTVTNLTNAPTSGDLTATMKTSVGTAVAASAVASVTGNVGGNVTGSVGSVASGGISEASFATTAGTFSPLGIVDQGTAQSATGTTLVLRSAAAFADDQLIGAQIVITGGSTGVGQTRTITDYVGATDTATVDTWTTTPTGTITYKIFASAPGPATPIPVTVTEIQASALADLFNTNSGTTYGSAVSGSVVKEIADNAGGSALTEAGIADAVWDELIAGHAVSGSTGEALSAAGGAGDPWITPLPGSYSAGQAGKIVGDALDAAISSRMATYTQPTGFLSATFPTDPADESLVIAATDAIYSRLGAPAGASMSADIAAVKADTAAILTDTGTTLDAAVAAVKADTAAILTDTGTTLDAALAVVDANVDAIKAKTDSLTFTIAGMVDSNVIDWKGATAPAMTGDAFARLGAPAGASVSADVAAMKVDTAAILADTGTDGVVVASASKTGYQLSSTGVDDILDEVVEGSTTLRQSVRLANSALGGKASGLATTNPVYRDLADTKDRIDATVDADGNRSAVTRDLT